MIDEIIQIFFFFFDKLIDEIILLKKKDEIIINISKLLHIYNVNVVSIGSSIDYVTLLQYFRINVELARERERCSW